MDKAAIPEPISEAQWDQVVRILQDKSFDNSSGKLLDYLATRTLREPEFPELNTVDVARAFFGTEERSALNRFAVYKARLTARLRDYYDHEGRRDPIALTIPSQRCYVGFVRQGLQAPPTRWERLSEERAAHIRLADFRRFLERQSGSWTTPRDLDHDASSWAYTQGSYPESALAGWDALFRHFESNRLSTSFSELRGVADAVGVDRRLLDALLSESVPDDCLLLELPTSPNQALKGSERCSMGHFGSVADTEWTYGDKLQVGVPNKRLRGTDAAFAYMRLEPGGFTSREQFAGDVFVAVLYGSVVVDVLDSGLSVRLMKHSYTHFNAEQNHVIRNTDDDEAHLFVIRFAQLTHIDGRHAIRQSVVEMFSGGQKSRRPERDWSAWSGVLSVFDEPGSWDPMSVDHVRNSRGLVRLLRSLRQPKFASAKSFLRRVHDERSYFRPRSGRRAPYATLDQWLWEVETNQYTVGKTLIPAIAELYDVFDLLLCEFLIPSCSRHVVVHRTPTEGHTDWVDIASIVRAIYELQSQAPGKNRGASLLRRQAGITFEIPVRSLACSEVSVSWLTLQPGRHTVANTQSGTSMLVPLEGAIAIEFLDRDRADVLGPIVAGSHVAHHDAEKTHRIRNAGDSVASVLHLRLHGTRSESEASQAAVELKRRRRRVP